LRHTFATELANADVSVYTLMKLLGHESCDEINLVASLVGEFEGFDSLAVNLKFGHVFGLPSIRLPPGTISATVC
jgi:site-specific recombinase XerC